MNIPTIKGYVLTVMSGLLLLAGALLLILQARNRAEFSLYGKNISIRFQQDGEVIGGANTSLLMLGSAVGGVAGCLLGWLLVKGIFLLRQGLKQADGAHAAKQLEQLAKAQDRQEVST